MEQDDSGKETISVVSGNKVGNTVKLGETKKNKRHKL